MTPKECFVATELDQQELAQRLLVQARQTAQHAGDTMTETHPGSQVHEALGPRDGEPVITKRRISAFTGSDLEVLLRSAAAEHIVLAGTSTSGVVLSTIREAADMDYRVTVLEDACADPDTEVHRVLMEKDAWIETLD